MGVLTHPWCLKAQGLQRQSEMQWAEGAQKRTAEQGSNMIRAEFSDLAHKLLLTVTGQQMRIVEMLDEVNSRETTIRCEIVAQYDTIVQGLSGIVYVLKTRFVDHRCALHDDLLDMVGKTRMDTMSKMKHLSDAKTDSETERIIARMKR
eukprot:Clim_evm84s150 gene=Clim_evmTU84s150